eukprot:IDg1417t1
MGKSKSQIENGMYYPTGFPESSRLIPNGFYSPSGQAKTDIDTAKSIAGAYVAPHARKGAHGNSSQATESELQCEQAQLNAQNLKAFDAKDLRKLHLQLRHGTATQMRDYIRTAGRWYSALNKEIELVLLACECKIAHPPKPHAVASVNPPNRRKHEDVAVDIINLEGFNFLHIVDKCTGWSEIGNLRRRDLKEQVKIFRKIQVLRHGPPFKIYGDNEYNKPVFLAFCDEIGAQFVPIPANDHEANGAVESANRILRSYFRRIRGKLASSYELTFGQKPRILDKYDKLDTDIITVEQHNEQTAQKRINSMLRSQIREYDDVKLGDMVYFWRDNFRWLGPARVIERNETSVTVMHQNRRKTSGLSRIRKTLPKDAIIEHQEEAIKAPFPITQQCSEEMLTPDPSQSTNVNPKRIPREVAQLQRDAKFTNNSTPSEPRMTRQQTRQLNEASRANAAANANASSNAFSTSTSSTEWYTSYITDAITAQPITNAEKMESFARERKVWSDKNAFEEVPGNSVPQGSNVIGSHVVYRRKNTGVVKGRIVPWGHRDCDKDMLRCDAPCMNFEVFRLILSFAAERKWTLGEMDVKAAYLQAKGFERDIYVHPPREEQSRGVLWKLTAAAYGLADSGRLWYLTSDAALTSEFGLTKSKYEPTLYYRKNAEGDLAFVLATQVDNYVYAGVEVEVSDFERFLQAEFDVGELMRRDFYVMGCEIQQSTNGDITLTQNLKVDELNTDKLRTVTEGRNSTELANPKELTAYKAVLGQMLFIGRMAQPVMLYHASHMATKTGRLQLHHLKDLAAIVRYTKRSIPTLLFKPSPTNERFFLEVYSDAAMGGKKENGGRGGFIVFRRSGTIVHPIYWSARKLRRVARSSTTAEILAAADAVSMALYLQEVQAELTYRPGVELTVDSHSVFNLSTSTKQPEEALNKIDLAAMREAFHPRKLRAVNWCPGYYLCADALTKDNRTSAALMAKILREGEYADHPDKLRKLSADDGIAPIPIDDLLKGDEDAVANKQCNELDCEFDSEIPMIHDYPSTFPVGAKKGVVKQGYA